MFNYKNTITYRANFTGIVLSIKYIQYNTRNQLVEARLFNMLQKYQSGFS